jgi:hypothetical protein
VRVQRLVRSACDAFVDAVEAESAAFGGDPGTLLVRADAAFARGNARWLHATRLLEGLFTWNRRLPAARATGANSVRDPELARVASGIAARQVEVRCWSSADWLSVRAEWQAYDVHGLGDPTGFVASFDRGRVNLAPQICERLDAVRRGARPSGGEAREAVAAAVATLAHEAEHLVAPGTEAETECEAVQAVRGAARALGVPAGYAGELASVYWHDVYPYEPPEYTTPLCAPDGPLDRTPGDGVWP